MQKAFDANFSTLKRAKDTKSDNLLYKERNRTLSHSLLIVMVPVSVAAPLVAV